MGFEGAVAVAEGHPGLGRPLDCLIGVMVRGHVGEPLALGGPAGCLACRCACAAQGAVVDGLEQHHHVGAGEVVGLVGFEDLVVVALHVHHRMPAAESLRRFEGAVAVAEGHPSLSGPLDRLVGVVAIWHVGEPLTLSDRGQARHSHDGSHDAGAYRDSPLPHAAAALLMHVSSPQSMAPYLRNNRCARNYRSGCRSRQPGSGGVG